MHIFLEELNMTLKSLHELRFHVLLCIIRSIVIKILLTDKIL